MIAAAFAYVDPQRRLAARDDHGQPWAAEQLYRAAALLANHPYHRA